MESPRTLPKLDYSSVTHESILELSKCDMSLLSNIYSRFNSDTLNIISPTIIRESLDLLLTFERISIFKKVIKDSEPFVAAAREYTLLVDSLSNQLTECKKILDCSSSRLNSATTIVAKTLESAEKAALTQLINSEIIDKFHILDQSISIDSIDTLNSFDEKIEKLITKGLNSIEAIKLANDIMSTNKQYKALNELIDIKNLELDAVCEHLFTHLRDLIKDYSLGSHKAELFFETLYLIDENLPFNKSLFILSHRNIYLNYLIVHLICAKIKHSSQLLSITRFDSINHLLAFAYELCEEVNGFIKLLNGIQNKYQNANHQNPTSDDVSSDISNLIHKSVNNEAPCTNDLHDNSLARVLEDKLNTFVTSHHLKTLRLLAFYIDKHKEEADSTLSFLDIFNKFMDDLMKDFESKIDQMEPEFVDETLSEIESGPALVTCDAIEGLVKKFLDKRSRQQ